MNAVVLVVRQRVARHWRVLVVAGVLLGIGVGLCLASLAAARRTASAYDRILARADAPDATVNLSQGPDAGSEALRGVAGFIGTADGVDRVVTTALLAPIHDAFPIEQPTLEAGRLPRPDASDEAFIN